MKFLCLFKHKWELTHKPMAETRHHSIGLLVDLMFAMFPKSYTCKRCGKEKIR